MLKLQTEDTVLACSNFLAAFSGGMLLGKAMKVIASPYIPDGSLLAFFSGIIFGLIALRIIPQKISRPLSHFFPFAGSLASFILLLIFYHYAVAGKLVHVSSVVFFVLLVMRFAFWFYSRVLRVAYVAGEDQKIAWIELGYYAGMILGLVVWDMLGVKITVIAALSLDAIFQFMTGILDFTVNRPLLNAPSKGKIMTVKNSIWQWRLVISIVFLTLGIQVVILSLTYHMTENFNKCIIAAFYFGAAMAAVICKKLKIRFHWKERINKIDYADIYSIVNGKKLKISFFIVKLMSVIFVILAIYMSIYKMEHKSSFFFFTCVFFAAFFYEVVALAILDKIGEEEKLTHSDGIITYAYGLMGTIVALGLWLLGLVQSYLSIVLIMTTIVSLFLSALMIGVRSQEYQLL